MSSEKNCNRCDSPVGEIVILNNQEPVCGSCIVSMGHMAKIAERVVLDMTPSTECMT